MTDAATDVICPFIIDSGLSRGQAVRLSTVLDTIISQHQYPERIGYFISETAVLASLLASTLKYEGNFTLQIQGDGAISTLVVNITDTGKIRGYVRYDEKALADAEQKPEVQDGAFVPAFFGQGSLSFMIEQKEQNYQGIVSLEQPTLTECIHQYFDQSEQIDTVIRMAVAAPSQTGKGWTAGALMLQRMPMDRQLAQVLKDDEINDLWQTAVILLKSAKDEELLDTELPLEKLLHRLYHLNDLHFFMSKQIEFGCRCSQEKVLEMLRRFPEKDRRDMVVDGEIKVDCQFCGKSYTLTLKDLDSGE